MPSREPELYKDKIEVSLDGRQIFYLFFGGAVIVGLVFVLGVLVGRRVAARGHLDRAETQAETDPLAALDRLERSDRLSFHGALRGGEAPTDVEKAIGELEKRRAAGKTDKPDKPDKKPEPAALTVAKADPRPARLDKSDEPVNRPDADRSRAEKSDRSEKSDKPEKSDKRSDAAASGDKKSKKHDDAEARPEPRSDGKPDAKSEPRSEARSDARSESKPERSDAKRSDTKGDKPVTRPDKADAKADAREARGDKRSDSAAPESKPDSDARSSSESKVRFTLQLSSFQDKAEADAFLAATKSAGFQPYVVEADVTGKGTFYRVRLGSYRSLDAANDAKADYERTAKKTAQVTRL